MDAHLRFAEYFNTPIHFKGYIVENHFAGLQARNGLLGREALFTRNTEPLMYVIYSEKDTGNFFLPAFWFKL